MLKHIKNLLTDNILFIAIGVTISIAYLSLMRVPKFTPIIAHLDKIEHAFAYCTLTICWLFSFKSNADKLKYFIVVSCIIFGILLEVLQATLTVYRTGDYLDILANTFGAVLGLTIFNLILKKNQVNLP